MLPLEDLTARHHETKHREDFIAFDFSFSPFIFQYTTDSYNKREIMVRSVVSGLGDDGDRNVQHFIQ